MNKVNIVFEFKNNPWGGGNQFLRNLKKTFTDNNSYSTNILSAKFILFNSHHNYIKILFLKYLYPSKIFVHRIDGPMDYRNDGSLLNNLIQKLNHLVADGTVFQSKWSKINNQNINTKFKKIIYNAPDNNIFNISNKIKFENKRIRIISTCWSKNLNKGHDDYLYLDKNLDFKKYEVLFIGRTNNKFNNIKHIQPLEGNKIINYFINSNIFFFPSKLEACSNSLIEAIHSGLAIVASNTSSNPELIKKNGLCYSSQNDIIKQINNVSNNLKNYQKIHNLPNLETVSKEYTNFFDHINELIMKHEYTSKKINFFSCFYFIIKYSLLMFVEKIKIKIIK